MKAERNLNILSYNIHKGFSLANQKYILDLIKKSIQNTNADLLCLQEVCGSIDHKHPKRLHPSQSQFEFLADGLWPHFSYGKNAAYKKGNHGNAILSRYPIVYSHNLNLSTNRLEKRGLLHVKIEVDKKQPLDVMTAHIDLLEKGRQLQNKKIYEYIKAVTQPEDPLILAGDFNDWREKQSSSFAVENKLREAFLEFNNEHAKTFPSFSPQLKLDRIYYRNLKIQEATCLRGSPWNKLSDHVPLFASFVF